MRLYLPATLVPALFLLLVGLMTLATRGASVVAGEPIPTPTLTPSINMIPEGNANNVNLLAPAANLWLCITGDCAGPGEGNLIVFQYATGITTGDFDGNTITDGLGAYEFTVDHDNFIISAVNPSDVVFQTAPPVAYPGGVDGVADGEGAARAPGICGFSLVALSGYVRFGCATTGAAPGPIGDLDLARLNLIPHEILMQDLYPGNDNGTVTVISASNCELVDVFGHPASGSINGGLTPVCGDLYVTVRILESDVNLDCAVDVIDQQLTAFRYGAAFPGNLYSEWYDLEPDALDLDIDVLDMEKIFARDGSTCQAPIQPQPPLVP